MRSTLVGAAVLAAVLFTGHQAVRTPVAGTPVAVTLPYCAEEDGSGTPGAPCWWPAADRDMIILASDPPTCGLDRSPEWGAHARWAELPCVFTDDAGTTITLTDQPIVGTT